jgi:hypothetical protein
MSGPTDPTDLAEPLGSSVRRLYRDRPGIYQVSGHRSASGQIELRKAHCGTSHYAIYEMPASQCHPATAKPGQSKHETGEAVDLGFRTEADKQYAHANAAAYGIHFPVSGEDWHAEAIGPTTSPAPGSSSVQDPAAMALVGLAASSSSGGGGAGGLLNAAELFTNPHTWFRVWLMMAGATLATLGVVLLVTDAGK